MWPTDPKGTIALRTAVSIMQKWRASTAEIESTLRISRSTVSKARRCHASVRLDRDQLTRISLVLNIHASLRQIFDNPENVYGFPSMENRNVFFEGKCPLEIISQGSILALYQTFQHVNSLVHPAP
jgi:hypothetical protein